MVPGLAVKGAEGLIHQDHLRVCKEGPGNGNPLLHASRQLAWVAVFKTFEAEFPDIFHGRGAPLCLRRRQYFKTDFHILNCRSPRKKGIFLKHQPDSIFIARGLSAVNEYLSGGGVFKARNDFQECCFSASARAYYGNELPFFHFQGKRMKNGNGFVPFLSVKGFCNTQKLQARGDLRFYCHRIIFFSRIFKRWLIRSPITPMTSIPAMISSGRWISLAVMII